ncbi:beta-phosphoglucomutase [Lacimicrobium alkaliphilum]|uniref:beta-phosphoglucomutase n=1 Tax=Lacimicrobium alkaliphilum TaxID=1526571 RepID=UPI000B0AA37B|nr:beta-phosphoglucomutase [Lacimicrobium alkaliphilum]
MTIKAFIFDLDGVLTDTAEYHFLAWKALADQLGVEFDKTDNEQLKGVDRMGSLQFILQKGGLRLPEKQILELAEQKNRHYQQLIAGMSKADLFEGVTELFNALKARNIAIGLASASKNAAMVLDRLGITDAFDYVADAGKIKQGKPHPEIFLTVADALNIPPLSVWVSKILWRVCRPLLTPECIRWALAMTEYCTRPIECMLIFAN